MVAIAKITSAVASQAHFGLMAGMGYGGIWRGYGGHTLYWDMEYWDMEDILGYGGHTLYQSIT
jgi:hypothetical protein